MMTVYVLTDWDVTGRGFTPFALVALTPDEAASMTRVMLFPGDW